jgi:D-amino-acid oxidase
VSDETTKSILQGCKVSAPELLSEDGEFEVLSVQCGLRPAREGGPRVEGEIVDGRWKVVHSYGHAGAG